VSRVAAPPDPIASRRAAWGTLVLGVLFCLPRLVLVWFARAVFDVLQIGSTLLFVAGLLVIAIAIFRFRALRTERVLAIGVAGAIGVAVAAVVVAVAPPGSAQVAYEGGLLAPPAAIAYQYLYVALGGLSQLGLMLVVGAVGVGITHWRSRRAR
jgi:hypothetical protein